MADVEAPPAVPATPQTQAAPGVPVPKEDEESSESTRWSLDERDAYEYMREDDPDLIQVERDVKGNRLIRALAIAVRGHAVPFRTITAIFLWTVTVTVVSWLLGRNWRTEGDNALSCRYWCSPIAIDPSVASYVGFALFLLLGFRVNEAYSRYMEGVKLWNDDIAGVVAAFVTYVGLSFPRGTFHPNDRERIFGLAAAFAVTLKRQLRDETQLSELESMLSESDLAAIQKAPDMPGYCCYLLNAYLVEGCKKEQLHVPPMWHTMMMNLVQQMLSAQGKCLRIKKFKTAYGMPLKL